MLIRPASNVTYYLLIIKRWEHLPQILYTHPPKGNQEMSTATPGSVHPPTTVIEALRALGECDKAACVSRCGLPIRLTKPGYRGKRQVHRSCGYRSLCETCSLKYRKQIMESFHAPTMLQRSLGVRVLQPTVDIILNLCHELEAIVVGRFSPLHGPYRSRRTARAKRIAEILTATGANSGHCTI